MIDDVVRRIVTVVESHGWKLYDTSSGSSIEECERFPEASPRLNIEYRLLPALEDSRSLRDTDKRLGYTAGYAPALATIEEIVPIYRCEFSENGIILRSPFRQTLTIPYETAGELFEAGFHITGQTQPKNPNEKRLVVISLN